MRWDPEAYEFVAAQAAYLGISVPEFCRQATMFRATVTWCRRFPDQARVMEAEIDAVGARRVLDEADPLEGRMRDPR